MLHAYVQIFDVTRNLKILAKFLASKRCPSRRGKPHADMQVSKRGFVHRLGFAGCAWHGRCPVQGTGTGWRGSRGPKAKAPGANGFLPQTASLSHARQKRGESEVDVTSLLRPCRPGTT
jgi:hypothetical protein